MTSRNIGRRTLLATGAALTAGTLARPALAQAAQKLRMVVFAPPSLGDFLPPIIKAQELDKKNGLDITFVERTPDAYATEFNTGEFDLGGSAAPLTIGIADMRGVEVTYLLNLFDFWGAVVTSRPEVKTLQDLQGKDLAAARGTTNYAMFTWFAKRAGVDVAKISVVNTTTPGLVTYALADRAAAVQLWEPAYTILKSRLPAIRTLDLQIEQHWQTFAGSTQIPYLGVAAQRSWAQKNAAAIPKLTATYRAASAWLQANPDAGAKLISPKGSADEQQAVAALVRANDRLRMNVRTAGELQKELQAVYRAGVEIGYFTRLPSDATIYTGAA